MAMAEMEEITDDIVCEVLSRLPAKTLASCKCVSKAWYSLISHPSLLRAHFQKSQDKLSGIFIQPDFAIVYAVTCSNVITYLTLDEKRQKRLSNSLDFLPEKVKLMGSCNGLLCCRSRNILYPLGLETNGSAMEQLVIYICNPHSKEWIAIVLRRKRWKVNDAAIGFAFYPFGSSMNPGPYFKLVSVQYSPEGDSNEYSFLVYTSETGKWTPSKDVCHCNLRIRKNGMIFVGSRFHWLTWEHHVITFDLERELSAVIKLPGPVMKGRPNGICLGVSQGCLHYVCAHVSEFKVWELKDYGKSEWILKYNLNLSDFFIKKRLFHGSLLTKLDEEKHQDETVHSSLFSPLAYSEEVLFLKLDMKLYSYDFRTTELKSISEPFLRSKVPLVVLPYTVSLAAAGVLKQGQQ